MTHITTSSLLLLVFGVIRSVVAVGNSTAKEPKPVIWKGEKWDYDFGAWSSFHIRVGSNEYNARVFPSTSWQEVLVVLPEACSKIDTKNDISCYNSRGLTVNVSDSTTWRRQGRPRKDYYQMNLGRDLGLGGNAEYGLDSVGLDVATDGRNMPFLKDQVLGGYVNTTIPVGIFGLNDGYTNFTNYSDPRPSYLKSMFEEKIIPSRSFSYTAGAIYRLKSVLGKIVFGGYDSSTIIPHNITFKQTYDSTDEYRHLVLAVQSIRISSSSSNKSDTHSSSSPSLNEPPFLARIDTTTPFLFLPNATLNRISSLYSLAYDEGVGLYYFPTTNTSNNTFTSVSYEQARLLNASFTFKLTDEIEETQNVVSITLPFAAFDLSASTNLAGFTFPNSKILSQRRYLPFKHAKTANSYTLGRAFLQEATIIADFHRKTFRIHQTVFKNDNNDDDDDDGTSESKSIVPIIPPAAQQTQPPSDKPKQPTEEKRRMSVPALIGLITACVIVLVFLPVILALFCRFCRRRRERKHDNQTEIPEVHGWSTEYRELSGDVSHHQLPRQQAPVHIAVRRSQLIPINSLPIELPTTDPRILFNIGRAFSCDDDEVGPRDEVRITEEEYQFMMESREQDCFRRKYLH